MDKGSRPTTGGGSTGRGAGKQSDKAQGAKQAAPKEPSVNYTAAQESRMPALTGSEKQVKWAEDIRRNALINADNAVRNTLEIMRLNRGSEYDTPGLSESAFSQALTQARKEFVDALSQQTSAKQWIDNRTNFGTNGVQNAIVNRAWTIAGYHYDREKRRWIK